MSVLSFSNARRAELITRESKKKQEFVYVALRQKGRWLLDNKKWRSIGTNKWMAWFL
jgi:hypothetical protein